MRQEDRETSVTVLGDLLKISKIDKMRQFYEALNPRPDDGDFPSARYDDRIRTNLSISGTDTGRFSSGKYFLEPSTNLQNQPKNQAKRHPLFQTRQVIVPSKGKALGSVDLSSAERRLLAYLADAKKAIEWTERGDEELNDTSYPYKKFAVEFFDDVDDWRDVTGAKYAAAKMIMLSLDRGVGPGTLKDQFNKDADIIGTTLSYSRSKDAHELFHETFPGYQDYDDVIRGYIKEHDYVRNVIGRRRMCFSRRSTPKLLDRAVREMVSFQAQAVGDLLNIRLRQMYDELDPHLIKILLQVHDEIVFEFDPSDWAKVKRETLRIMEQPVDLTKAEPPTPHEEIVIPAEFEMSTKSWADMEEV